MQEVKKYWHELNLLEQEAVKSSEYSTYSRPNWCNWEYAMELGFGCLHLQWGYIHGKSAVICEGCRYSKTNKGEK